jgi:hypothetical protein
MVNSVGVLNQNCKPANKWGTTVKGGLMKGHKRSSNPIQVKSERATYNDHPVYVLSSWGSKCVSHGPAAM